MGHHVGECRKLRKVQEEATKANQESAPKNQKTQATLRSSKAAPNNAKPSSHLQQKNQQYMPKSKAVPSSNNVTPDAAILTISPDINHVVDVHLDRNVQVSGTLNIAAINQEGSNAKHNQHYSSNTAEDSIVDFVFSANSHHQCSSTPVESYYVPCSIPLDRNKSSPSNSTTNSSSNYIKSSTTISLNRSLQQTKTQSSSFRRHLIVPYPLHYTRTRVFNKYSPLSEHFLDGDGDEEAWEEHYFEENFVDNDEDANDYIGFYTPAGSNQYMIAPRNWTALEEEPPYQSWAARADEEFAEAMAKIDANNRCIQLEQDDRSYVLDNDSSSNPAQTYSHEFPQSTNSPSLVGSVYVSSPIQTRAQRLKKGTTVLPLHKQKKMSKAAKREANAISRLIKTRNTPIHHDPDDYQWKVYEKDKKKRDDEVASAKAQSNEDQH